MTSIEQIKPVVESRLHELGFELFDLRFFQAGKRSTFRITVDSPKGITIADCETISREISLLLDAENFASGKPYNLEVSSPGIDRPLTTERDFNRIQDKDVVLHLKVDIEGKKKIKGKVVKCEDNILTVENEYQNLLEIPLSDIYSGREEIRFK
ncbi:ribosome maturation protein RimP [Chitinispirillum alkaliphilum]|nr:ribosome maturation protein RimP [Chitinispirillum alkaliphilum]